MYIRQNMTEPPKVNEILTHAATCMNLENVLLNELSQSQ